MQIVTSTLAWRIPAYRRPYQRTKLLWLVAFRAGMGLVVELIRLPMAAAGMKTH